MTSNTFRSAAIWLGLALVSLTPAPAAAVDREHQQIEADIRMLQEQANQLQQLLAGLGDALKQLNSRIDEQTALERKSFADGKVQMDNLSGDVRIVREKVDETNVRLSSLSQEMEAIRTSLPQPGATISMAPPADPSLPGQPGPQAGTSPVAASAPPPVIPGQTPQRMWDAAFGDYTMTQYPLAIQGFDALIKSYPKSDMADDAQFYIGEAFFNGKKFTDAAAAYARVISDYPTGNQVPNAYYKRGVALENIPGQTDSAKQSYQAVIDKFPDAMAATLAKQRLEGLSRR